MKSGICPKCATPSVHASSVKNEVGFSYGDGDFTVHVKEWVTSGSRLKQYICVNCGYFESYIVDEAKLGKVAALWLKVRT